MEQVGTERAIQERSRGRWAIVLEVRDEAIGKRKRSWYSFKGTKRQAQDECARLITDLKNGNALEPNKTTVAQFLERWLDHIRTQVSPKSHERYAGIVHQNLIPALGAVRLQACADINNLLYSPHRRAQGRNRWAFAANGGTHAPGIKTGSRSGPEMERANP
jgi:hypothetical protein